MATVAHLNSTASSANTTSYASGSFTPTANDLLVVFVGAPGTTAAAPTLTDSLGLVTFTLVEQVVKATGADTMYLFVADSLAAASARTLTFDCSADAATGAYILIAGVAGMSRAGISAVRQKGKEGNQSTGTTPDPTFTSPVAALTGNPTLGAVFNLSNPATVTEPTGWTEHADVGGTSPTTGIEYVSRNSGFTGTQITWGSTSPTGFGAMIVELDASVPATIVTPSPAALTVTAFAPTLKISIVPATATLVVTALAPVLKSIVIPTIASLAIASFQPAIGSGVIPAAVSLSISPFAPTLLESVTPTTASLTLTTFAPSPATVVIPGTASLTITTNAPSLASVVIPTTLSLSTTTFVPSVLPFNLVFLDPGGDAVQAVGYFNTPSTGTVGILTYDTAQQAVGVGSYKFDSDTGLPIYASVAGVLGSARRVSTYFRYDSVPDAIETVTEFGDSGLTDYSGGGFDDLVNFAADDGFYATATPAQNAGQGTVFGSFDLPVPVGAVIDLVKIIYKRKYDINTSEGISRVKWRVDGIEGPDHDNTDEPTTDTVVTVDVTADRSWEWPELRDVTHDRFEIIAEARRGDTATSHTQSWDYVKVEVQYHLPTAILKAMNAAETKTLFQIAITPKGTGTVLRFVDGAGASYDGITDLLVDTWNRVSFSYVLHGADDLDINLHVNGIQELSIVGASTDNASEVSNLHYGWIFSPGANHLCWFDVLHIDDGDDLSDCGNKLSTHKGPASTNENNWNTTLGTGAVDERPLSITNGKQHTAVTGVRQSYTLQAASVGDIDLTGETIVGYMGWAWAKMQSLGETVFLVVNGVDIERSAQILTTPSLLKHAVTSSAYPSNAAGIGMLTNEEGVDTWLYECGAIVAYEGVAEDQILPFQLLAQDSLTDLTDDLRASPPSSYELCYRSSDSAIALATVTVSSLDQETGSIQQQAVIPCNGGIGRVRIVPGIEVQISIAVTGGDISLGLWHRLNVD